MKRKAIVKCLREIVETMPAYNDDTVWFSGVETLPDRLERLITKIEAGNSEYFFSRGNAHVRWGNVPPWAWFVTVGPGGLVMAWEQRLDVDGPIVIAGIGGWYGVVKRAMIAHVGAECPDWQALIFERPAPYIETPEPPVRITAAEKAAIQVFLPGAVGVAKDGSGAVYAYVKKPRFFESDSINAYWWMDCREIDAISRTRFLDERFADVDPAESWTVL